MIQLSAAGKRFGHKLLFEAVDWMITPNDRVGLVGGNGTGKSTMLKIIAGIEAVDQGEIRFTKGMRIGYLPQDGLSLSGRSVFDETLTVFADLQLKQQEVELLSEQLAHLDPASPEFETVADRLHLLDSHLTNFDAYSIEAQVGAVLTGLGFAKDVWSKSTEEFSGGWQMRIALAKLLLQRPDILLLDEPTNHLDLEARNWLEEYLKSYPNAYVLISHDRFFLDMTVSKTVELWNKRMHLYHGNYSKYEQLKTERRQQLDAAYKNQRDKIEQLEAFINRFRAQATKAKQVQSRIKELEKIERIELPPEEKTIHFNFAQPKPSGRVVAEFIGVDKSYGEKRVLSRVDFVIERGDRIALVGVNGAGKSTLIKLLAALEPLNTGEYKLGHNVDVDYFAQDQYKALDPKSRMLDDLRDLSPRSTETELRSLLGSFLFSDDDVFKQIGVLSGGERNRYALAKLLLRPSNFLLLDEPTNHLDMRAKDVLLDALENFTGTVVFVSHDRYFIDKLATRVFQVANGAVHVFPGNYEDYLYRKEQPGGVLPPPTLADALPSPANGTHPKPQKRVNPQKLQQLQSRCASIESEITTLESQAAEREAHLQTFRNSGEILRLTTELDQLRTRISQLTSEWDSLTAQLEELQSPA
jgi:ATP-binding cassette subfamily F protein 3